MTYKSIERGYVFWNDEIIIKFKTKNGKDAYLKKEVLFEDAPNYWEYVCEDDLWNVYYVKRGVNRRMARCNIGKLAPESIIAQLSDKDISVNDCRKIEEERGRQVDRIPVTGIFWSTEYDGKSILELMEQWDKMPYDHIKMVIENEGGSIDKEGIIHKGN